MKTKLFFLILTVGAFMLNAQVFIGDGFIYSKGTHIYVEQDINISSNGAFYLRDEAQLIQEDNVDNEGEGFLSIFQEGTQNEFTYNYWSAPVGLANSTAGNLGFDMDAQTYFPKLMAGFGASTFDAATPAANLSTNLVIDADLATVTAVSNPTGLTDLQDDVTFSTLRPLTISGRWLYEYNNNGAGGGSYANWQAINTSSNPTVSPGYGFSMKGVTQTAATSSRNLVTNAFTGFEGQRYDFRGRPNNGNINVTVSTDDVALAGNPYPSALDLKRFLDDNTDVNFVSGTWTLDPANSAMNPEILYWESVSTSHQLTDYIGGYGTYVPNGFATGSSYGYDNNGTYVQAAYSRYNSDGSPSGGSVFGATSSISGVNRRLAPVGQGFMITRPESAGFTASTTGTVNFTNSQRLFYKESDGVLSFFANAPGGNSSNITTSNNGEIPKIRFNAAVNDLYVRELVLQFDPTVTMDYDYSWEGSIDNNRQVNDVFMPVTGNDLIINSIPFSVDKVVPVTFEVTSNSVFEFGIKELENFDTPFILLEDTRTGMVYNLKTSVATLQLPVGLIENRFQIIFQQPVTLSNDDNSLQDQFDVIQNNNLGQVTVLNPSEYDISSIALFDLGGKLIFDEIENNNNSQYVYKTDQLSTGIYIIRITTADANQAAIKLSISN